mgnify:CR=1 FL=1
MNHTGTISLETDRLRLRRFTDADAEKMFANWAGNPNVTRYLPWKYYDDVEGVRTYLKELQENYRSPDFYDWCIEWKKTGDPIGSIGAVSVNERLRAVGIGYCLSESFWGKGIVAEALRAVLQHFFKVLGAVRVTGAHFTANPNSGKVLVKCGFFKEGTLRKGAIDNTGHFVDVNLYAVTDDDFLKNGL